MELHSQLRTNLTHAPAQTRRIRRLASSSRQLRAFTLIEVLVVVSITAILAVSVVPAFASMADARRAAAAREIERLLLLARARAMATSTPHALQLNTTSGAFQLVCLNRTTLAVEPALDASGSPWPATTLNTAFPGVSVSSIQSQAAGGSSTSFWFSFNGTPDLRNLSGERIGSPTTVSQITLTGNLIIQVHPNTGAVMVDYGNGKAGSTP